MPTFKYQAKDARGKTVSGTVNARSQGDVLGDLRRRNLVVLNVREAGAGLAGTRPALPSGVERFNRAGQVGP